MTKDYALFLLNQLYVGASVEAMPIIPQSELSQALSVAIKALEQQPCEDCISRQAVLDTISELNVISFYEAQEDSKECYYEIRDAIKQLPPAASYPKTGKWIVSYPDGAKSVKCNICNNYNRGHVETYFCPSCGAKMEEDIEE